MNTLNLNLIKVKMWSIDKKVTGKLKGQGLYFALFLSSHGKTDHIVITTKSNEDIQNIIDVQNIKERCLGLADKNNRIYLFHNLEHIEAQAFKSFDRFNVEEHHENDFPQAFQYIKQEIRNVLVPYYVDLSRINTTTTKGFDNAQRSTAIKAAKRKETSALIGFLWGKVEITPLFDAIFNQMKEKVLAENLRFLDLPVDPPAPLIELPEEIPNNPEEIPNNNVTHETINEKNLPKENVLIDENIHDISEEKQSEEKQSLLYTKESLSCDVLEEKNPDKIKYQEIYFDGSEFPPWAWMFYGLKEDSDRKHEEISKNFSDVTAGMKYLVEQNKQLQQQNKELSDKLEVLVEEAAERAQKSLEKQNRKEKRKNANKQIQRDAISYPEFEAIITSAEFRFKDIVTRARVICALTLLFFTGLRISNLLPLTHRNMNELLTDGKTTISLIKGGKQRHTIYVGLPGQMYLKKYQPYIDFLMFINKTHEPKLLFFSQEKPTKAINRVNFTNQVNEHLENHN
jgi:site-specific recombinase XerD